MRIINIHLNIQLNRKKNKIKHKNGLTYQPIIGTIPSEEQSSWQFSQGKWFKREKHRKENLKTSKYTDKFGELAIKLTLTN